MYIILVYILIAILGFFLICELINRFSKRLQLVSKIPTAPCFIFIGSSWVVYKSHSNLFKVIREWCANYKPIFCSWCGSLLYAIHIVNPEDSQVILSNVEHHSKAIPYNALHEWLGTGLLTSSGEKWHKRRKILTPTFHFNILISFIQTFNKYSNQLVEHLKENHNQQTTIDILPIIKKCSLHSLAETAMGTRLSNNRMEQQYRKSIAEISEIIVTRFIKPWLQLVPVMKLLTYNYYKERHLLTYLKGFTTNVIREREQTFDANILLNLNDDDVDDDDADVGVKKRLAMLDLLISAKRNGEIDDEGIREEVDTFMFEGHDTVSIALSFCLMLLANHQAIQDRVLDEIDSVLGECIEPTYDMLANLKYMDRVIKETLRMYPSVPIIGRVLGSDERVPSGYILPKDSTIFIHIFDMHYDPSIYPLPHEFNPDRFLPDAIKQRHPFAYLPFSAGSRNCIGQRYAMLNMKSILCRLVKEYELIPIDTPASLVLVVDLVLRSKNGIKIKLRKRI